jgi:hypothetical protein
MLYNSLAIASGTRTHPAIATLSHLLTHVVSGFAGENTHPSRVSIWQGPGSWHLLAQASVLVAHAIRCVAKRDVMEESGPAKVESTDVRMQSNTVKARGRMVALC